MHTSSHIYTDTHTYGISLAHSLIAYAGQCDEFADILYTLVHMLDVPLREHTQHDSRGLTLCDTEHATRRARWLLYACTERRIPQAGIVLSTLVTWARAREWEQPKAVILGLDMGVWPVGIWGKVKRKYEPMSIILRNDTSHTTTQTLRSITHLTHRVVEKGLVSAGGHTGTLEPELGDWLFGEKNLALFHATVDELREIEAHLTLLDAPYATDADTMGTTILAMSPSVYLFDIPYGDALLPIE